MIEVVHLEKRLGGRPVLRDLSVTIPSGRITALIGPSGSGKTVLLRHLLRLLRPDSGRILVDGQDIVPLAGRALRRLRDRFGVLFQGGALFDSLTVFDNVAFPLREKTRMPEHQIAARVHERLAAVGLEDMGAKLPAELSGGMRKRAALARALIQDPELAFFDEPTTGLDPILLHSIQDLIAGAWQRHRFTAVLVSHDIPEVFEIAQWVAVMDAGRVIEQGLPESVQASQHPTVRRFLTGAR